MAVLNLSVFPNMSRQFHGKCLPRHFPCFRSPKKGGDLLLNERCGEILHRILQSKTALRVEILAKDLGISERTIRYDLNRIDDYLNEQGLPPLSRKSREGISLHLTAAQVSRFQSGSYKEEPYRYVLSQKERIAAIAYTLLSHNDYIPVQRLADSLHVSKTTIYADIQEFKEQLDPTGRYVKTAKGKGVLLTGNESALRNLVLHSLLMNSDELNFSDVSYLEMFRLIPLERLQDFVKEAETQLNKFFSDYALRNMVLHLAIAVKRIQLGRTVEMVHEELSHLIKAPEFSVAAGIAARIEETCAIHIPESEIAYITIHLLGSSFSTETQAQDIYLQMVVSTLIARMCQECGIPFDRDEQLYENLGEHMGPAIYRFRHGININNPLIDEIRRTIPIFSDVYGGRCHSWKRSGTSNSAMQSAVISPFTFWLPENACREGIREKHASFSSVTQASVHRSSSFCVCIPFLTLKPWGQCLRM